MVVGQDGREVPGDYQGKHITTDHSKRPQICNRLVQETVPLILTHVSRQPGVLGIGCNVGPLRKWGVVSNVNGSTLHLSSLALSSARPGTRHEVQVSLSRKGFVRLSKVLHIQHTTGKVTSHRKWVIRCLSE